VIYLDTSIALAHLFGEDRVPPAAFWREKLTSSRLLEYEIWTRFNARRVAGSHSDRIRGFIDGIALLDLTPPVLTRALEPFPVSVRTLDALHLASADFLRAQGQRVEIATYDERMAIAAKAIGLAVAAL
jgi:uncharacterized protein